MITREDWLTVNRELMAEQRERLGEPPTAEELLAYMKGELSEVEQEAMRERLVAWPELARSLAEPFPEEPNVVRRNVFTYSKAMAIAATVLLLFGGLLWREYKRAGEPRATWQTIPLLPDGARGPELSPVLPANADYVLVPALNDDRVFSDYRIDIIDVKARPERVVWSRANLQRRENDTLVIYVRRAFLERGRYRLAVYGLEGRREIRLETYTFRVP
jgi:hypothetical protein